MKYIVAALFCSFIMMTALPAQATLVNRDQANEYFAQCIKKVRQARAESGRALCACSSARVMTELTAEELAVLAENTPEGQVALKKMLAKVYAPCTEVIASEMFDFECVNNKQLYELNKGFDIPSVCSCASKKTAVWYKGKAQGFMTESLKTDPGMTIASPVGALLAHPQVKSQNLNNLVACSAEPEKKPAAAEPAATEPTAKKP